MKRITLLFMFVTISLISFSQEQPANALGIRLGGGFGFDWEVSYQRYLSDQIRMENGLGMAVGSNRKGFTTTTTIQWVWDINSSFKWFTGPGLQLGSREGLFYFGLTGQVGIEYLFREIPFQIGIDTRPVIGIENANNAFEININASIRYLFGK